MYTAVNNSSGELMAMKEIAIQPGETRAIKNVAEELKIFEGISHKHLVKLYGVEIHRVSVRRCGHRERDPLIFPFDFTGGTADVHGIVFRRYARESG